MASDEVAVSVKFLLNLWPCWELLGEGSGPPQEAHESLQKAPKWPQEGLQFNANLAEHTRQQGSSSCSIPGKIVALWGGSLGRPMRASNRAPRWLHEGLRFQTNFVEPALEGYLVVRLPGDSGQQL